MTITMIVAMDLNNAIGKDNKLLWHIPSDLKHFKKTTTGKTVVMGRKTFDSIGKPLSNRTNIVLTREIQKDIKGCYQATDLSDILTLEGDIFVIGGQQIYELFLPFADQLLITHVHDENNEADVFFPEISYDEWESEEIENNYDIEPYYAIIRYKRKTADN